MFERIAIMGAGSLGTVLGAFLSQRRQVDLIDTNLEHVDALNQHGASVCGTVTLTEVPVHALTPGQMDGTYDLFIYMAKQTCNDACLHEMLQHAHADTYVCCCQNGLPEAAVCRFFPEDRVFGAPVGWGATWLRPGCSQSNTERRGQSFMLGSLTGECTPALLEVKKILEYMCPVELSGNLLGQRWAKLHINAAYSGMSAVLGGTFGQVCADPIAIRWAVRAAKECRDICHINGIKMPPGHSSTGAELDLMRLYDYTSPEEEESCIETVRDMNHVHNRLVASMLQDLRQGTPCEVDAIDGVVVEAGRQAGIPTPYISSIRDAIRAKEAGIVPVERFAKEYYPG